MPDTIAVSPGNKITRAVISLVQKDGLCADIERKTADTLMAAAMLAFVAGYDFHRFRLAAGQALLLAAQSCEGETGGGPAGRV